MSTKVEPLSILDNGQLTHSFTYKVNGVTVREVLSLDTMNGDFGTTQRIQAAYGTQNIITPDSELGRAILNGDDGGARQNEFLNAIDDISTKVNKQSLSNSTTLENSLRESGMYEISTGMTSLPKIVPEAPNEVDSDLLNLGFDNEGLGEGLEGIFDPNNGFTSDIGFKDFLTPPPNLKFPKDAYYDAKGGPSQDYVKIDMFKYQAPQEAMLGNAFQGNIPKTKKEKKAAKESARGTFKKTLFGGLKSGKRTKEYKGTVKLPIPNQLGSSNSVAWGEGSANAFEAAAFMAGYTAVGNLLNGSEGILSLAAKGAGEARDLLGEFQKQGGDAAQLVSAQATKMALQQLNINTDTRQFVTRATGKAVNPNLETLFSGPKIRSFSFQFAFMPQDEQDSDQVRRIMRFFKQGMLPARGSSGGSSGDLFLLSPNVFRIAYMNGENRIKSLNTFKMCALTGCEINFTPSGLWSAYDDTNAISQPTTSTMTLSFSELTPIFADDYESNKTNKERLADQIDENGPLSDWFTDKDIGF